MVLKPDNPYSTLIPYESGVSFRRWDLPDFTPVPEPDWPMESESTENETQTQTQTEAEPTQTPEEVVAEPPKEPPPSFPTAEEIERIQTDAYEEAFRQGQAEGYTQGYARGHEEGLTAANQAMQPHFESLATLLQGLAEPYAELDEQVEQELVALTKSLVRHLVRRELATRPDEIVAAVREAVKALPAAARTPQIWLHPEDAKLIREAMTGNDGDPPWRIVEDPGLTRGGCRVVAEATRIDATVEHRLHQVITAVFGGQRESDDGKA